jgi:DNA-binding NtrC family response regulator
MCSRGEFKEDLFQRLNVIPIHLPPLRERKEDIPLLVEFFVQKNNHSQNKITFTQDALDTLKHYSWPGNIRELANVIDYVLTMVETTEVNEADLPPRIRDAARKAAFQPSQAKTDPKQGTSFYQRVAEFEAQILSQEYQNFKGNISQLALALEMDRSHLYTKLKEYQIHHSRRS